MTIYIEDSTCLTLIKSFCAEKQTYLIRIVSKVTSAFAVEPMQYRFSKYILEVTSDSAEQQRKLCTTVKP